MDKVFIKYLILPKGFKSILFKSYVYFIPFLYYLYSADYHWYNSLKFVIILFLFELLILPARYQINDIVDYKEDQQRKNHWQRPVNSENGKTVFTVLSSRFLFGTILTFFLDIRLGYLSLTFLALQLFYDFFAKKKSCFLAVLTISVAYPLRSLLIIYGMGMAFNQTIILLLLSIFLYGTYMVFQWRRNESYFISNNKLIPKPNSESFKDTKIKSLLFINLFLFITIFILSINSLLNISKNDTIITLVISLSFSIILSLLNKENFEKLIEQSQNFFIIAIFLVLTTSRPLLALTVSIITIFIIFWYHRIYIEKFSENYFNKKHYDNIHKN